MEERGVRINKVYIIDANVVTAVGRTLRETWTSILHGRSGVAPVERFSTDMYESHVAATIPDLERKAGRSMICDLIDRLYESTGNIPDDAKLLTATTKLGIDNLECVQQGTAAATSDILPASMPEIVSRKTGVTNAGVNISASCASSTIAIAQASTTIAGDYADSFLVCCADIVTEFTFSGFSSLKVVSAEPPRPFDKNRNGLNLGDGAAALLLMSEERMNRENRTPLAEVAGWGVASDAFHITSPDPDGSGLVSSIENAMRLAQISPDDVSAVSAHGTGTLYNDTMELTAFGTLFGDRSLPVYSVKGATGHTIGAAGGIEVALAVEALRSGIALPTVGFREPDAGAEGKVNNEAVPISGDYVLTCNSGFGGINAAIILKRC